MAQAANFRFHFIDGKTDADKEAIPFDYAVGKYLNPRDIGSTKAGEHR